MDGQTETTTAAPGEGPAIGIDLGTTYSCVAVIRHNRVEVVANDLGHRTTPSMVAFTDSQRLVGNGAENQVTTNPCNSIFDAKRLIGRRYSDPLTQKDMKLWPFKVAAGDDDKPVFVVQFRGEERRFAPEVISAMVLARMRSIAEIYLGTVIKNAVITVPAYFNNSQRQATKDAGVIAGLNVMRIINEPTAAAIAYGFDQRESGIRHEKSVLIFDLGGGTFDVSLLHVENGTVKVKATAGDTHLGGEDFNNRMVDYFADVFMKQHGRSITSNPKALRRLRSACDRVKRNLSNATQTMIEIDSLHEGVDFKCIITRAKFEGLNMDLFRKCLDLVDQCLKDANMSKADVDEVVLVGGSTRIPKVRELLSEYFDRKALKQSINPDEAVACGDAAMLSGAAEQIVEDLVLQDITPLSLGVGLQDGTMDVIVPRNTPVPAKKKKVFKTVVDYQSSVSFCVYEGEMEKAKDNHFLGEFILGDVLPAPAGVPRLDVTFEIGNNGILTATAVDTGTGRNTQITITGSGKLSKAEVERMVEQADAYRRMEEEHRRAAEARNELEKFAYEIKDKAGTWMVQGEIHVSETVAVEEAVEVAMGWLVMNEHATADEVKEKMSELQKVWQPISKRMDLIRAARVVWMVVKVGFAIHRIAMQL